MNMEVKVYDRGRHGTGKERLVYSKDKERERLYYGEEKIKNNK